MKKIIVVFILVYSILFLISCNQNKFKILELDEKLSRYFNFQELDDNPGTSILVSIKGKVLYQKSFGISNVERSQQVSPETTFRIGSITKQFTATAILLLEERGLLLYYD